MTTPFHRLHHICLVVHDIDAAQTYYESIGVGPWREYPPLTEYTDLDVPSPEAFRQMRYRVVDLDNVQLQLCQPPELDCPQRRFLDTHGEGVFHLGFEHDVDGAIALAGTLGLDVLMRGQRPDGSGFVYFDTRDRAAVVLETRRSPQAS
ncbi:MAG TPA: VOC family protein [Jatrophihabitans sp.]|uniref:VOC family protein n=1 Tax=Jatrophihabitans sp. TaxID=1932789 RepID=UPI002DF7E38F|nr:VOC family protein [Jatrophihabitans sp.]